MADKSKHSKDTVVNGVSLEQIKKQLLAKAKAVGEISMKEISDTLAFFELENEEQANLSISFENCISKFSKCVEQKYTKLL